MKTSAIKSSFILGLFVWLFYPIQLSAINVYSVGDTLYAWAEGGLIVRDAGTFSGNKIGLIPYGEKLIVSGYKLNRHGGEEAVNILQPGTSENGQNYLKLDLRGSWVRIWYKGIEGFVFDGYMSSHPAPTIVNSGFGESLDHYLERHFGVLSEDEKGGDDYVIRHKVYGNGFSSLNIGSKGAYMRYILPDFSLEEIVLFLKNNKSTNLDGLMRLTEDVRMNDQNVRVLNFESNINGEGYLSITVVSGMIIIETDSSC